MLVLFLENKLYIHNCNLRLTVILSCDEVTEVIKLSLLILLLSKLLVIYETLHQLKPLKSLSLDVVCKVICKMYQSFIYLSVYLFICLFIYSIFIFIYCTCICYIYINHIKYFTILETF